MVSLCRLGGFGFGAEDGVTSPTPDSSITGFVFKSLFLMDHSWGPQICIFKFQVFSCCNKMSPLQQMRVQAQMLRMQI